MALELLDNLSYFLTLSLTTEVLWVVLPLFLVTIVMVFYFEKYRDEKPGWNTHVANSLVLLFVSMSLFRHIYNIDSAGAINFIYLPHKFFISLFVLVLGIFLLFINFGHFLPEKVARALSSPLTINTFAYVVVLFVYSKLDPNLQTLLSLIIWFLLVLIIFNLIKIPLQRFFRKIQKLKEKEEVDDIAYEKKKIKTQKQYLKSKEKKITKEQKKKAKKLQSIGKKIRKA